MFPVSIGEAKDQVLKKIALSCHRDPVKTVGSGYTKIERPVSRESSMTVIVLKAAGLWLILPLAGILNGIVRETVLTPILGSRLALPASGLSLSLLVICVAVAVIPWLGAQRSDAYWVAGGLWALLTVAFEICFGRWGAGRSWSELIRVFDVRTGDLMVLVVAATALSPYLAARIRGVV
jgi:hypothetical protein